MEKVIIMKNFRLSNETLIFAFLSLAMFAFSIINYFAYRDLAVPTMTSSLIFAACALLSKRIDEQVYFCEELAKLIEKSLKSLMVKGN